MAPGLPLIVGLLKSTFAPIGASALISIVYQITRRMKILKVRSHHLKRAIINVYLFAFAPLSRSCVEYLMCPIIFDGTPDGTAYLGLDMSVECYEGEHLLVAIVSAVVLFVAAVVVPIMMLVTVKNSLEQDGENGVVLKADVMKPSHWDVVYRDTKPRVYWWFAFMMIMKLAINTIYIFGLYYDYPWRLCMQIFLLGCTVMAYRASPYGELLRYHQPHT